LFLFRIQREHTKCPIFGVPANDISYKEEVVWKNGNNTSDEVIKKALIEFSLSK